MRAAVLAFLAMVLGSVAAFAQSDYRIQPGDVLAVEVVQDPSLNREVLVLPDGKFSFPYAGTVQASGLTLGQVQQSIKSGIATNFAVEPTVFVSIRQVQTRASSGGGGGRSTIGVYFLGEFASPGLKQMAPGTSFLQALAQGGAFTSFAAQKRIQLRRTDAAGRQTVTTIDYRSIANGGTFSHDITLRDGDIILVPERRLFE